MKERPILFSGSMVQAILEGRKTQTRRVIKNIPPMPEIDCHPKHVQKFEKPYFDAYCGQQKTEKNPRGMGQNWNWWQVDNRACLPQIKCPFGVPGDQLWVRETFQPVFEEGKEHGDYVNYETGEGYAVSYPATDGIIEFVNADDDISSACKPSIYMPRWASRIQLEITGIRVERLNDCSSSDAISEGIESSGLVINGISEGAHYRDYIINTNDICEWFTNPIASYESLWLSINGPDSWNANPWVWVIEFKRVERTK